MFPSDILKLSSFYYANLMGSKAEEKKDDPLPDSVAPTTVKVFSCYATS